MAHQPPQNGPSALDLDPMTFMLDINLFIDPMLTVQVTSSATAEIARDADGVDVSVDDVHDVCLILSIVYNILQYSCIR